MFCYLHTMYSFLPLPTPPVLGTISSPQSINVTTTQLAGFQCNANDFSPPYQITWYRESAKVSPVPGHVHMVPETGTLFVRNVRNSDSGSYRCTVTNPAGSVDSESAQLNVMPESELGEAILSLIGRFSAFC